MIEEILKRPFVRPLLFWIIGILLQVCFPLQQWSFLLLLPVIFSLLFSLKNKETQAPYSGRWLSGIIIGLFFIFLAIQMTALAEWRMQLPIKDGFLQQQAKAIQDYLVANLDGLNLNNNQKSLLATLTINYQKSMSWQIRDQFAVTGVAHILSVSGFHVGIVCSFFSLLFSVFPKGKIIHWIRYFCLLIILWIYAYISGLSAPSVRAAIMLTIYLTGQAVRRYPDRYNSLAAAAFCMLVYNPFYLFDVGFQLSFTAVFFILYLQPKIYNLLPVRNPLIANLWGTLTVTIAAQIGTVFICFYYFGQTSSVFLFTNLLLSLLSTILIPVTLLWMLFPNVLFLSNILQQIIEFLTKGMMWVVEGFYKVPGAALSLKFDFITLIFSYLSLGFFLVYLKQKNFKILIASMVVLLFILVRQLCNTLFFS